MQKILIRVLCVFLILSVFAFFFAFLGSHLQPQPPTDVTLDLGNAWTDVFHTGSRPAGDLTISNQAGTSQVMVRVVQDGLIVSHEKKLAPGASLTYPDFPSGSYVIQCKSPDGIPREYTLHLEN